ncbi:hypothetical protein [Oceanicella actignis]|uniref:Uncharacterized protein n=1 Tax=Oceanicella actignis TaxID=1189325 RepID=A0A1M7TJH5_9RHOB|nr:hypothetical protein [Oceanicella actignis]TYO88178.1 hypothetical protein LY05_02327 [Oceanicella actignis]SET66750.1 hypothetical protein SAMN04488119_10752 [Oceanicella actignis]SHN70909.1 hypothetical protein SAMN05216200_10751 [Oceanicella actignis]
MAVFSNDWWPSQVRRPRLRLLAALALSPALAAIPAGLVGFVVAGLNLSDGGAVREQTAIVALSALGALLAFMGSFGLAAILALWATRRRSAGAFALAGAAAGALFLLATNLLVTGLTTTPAQMAAFALLGALTLLIARRIAGVRPPPEAPAG